MKFFFYYLVKKHDFFFGFFFFRSASLQLGAAVAEIKEPSVENQSSNVLSLKPGIGQYIAMHDTPSARDFYPPGPFICIFPKPLPSFPGVSCS